MKILILVLSAFIILLCLLQDDKSTGILSLNVKTNNSKNSKVKYEKLLNAITAISVLALFICLFVEML